MSFLSDLKIIYHMAVSSNRGNTHAERLEGFYQGQAGAYDDFRRRLLQGRAELFSSLPTEEGGLWLDMGGGTGVSLEFMGDKRAHFKACRVLDLSPSLLKVARERIADRGWGNAEAVVADVTTYAPPEGQADLVTFSYSLTMIPDWFAAIDHAFKLLKPGGHIGVVDFYIARKHPADGHARHPWRTRSFWPVWFANDNVFLSPDHIPYLHRLFEPVHFSEHRAKVPYMPLARSPYYRFIGRKP
jgi:S-adenosylmethionine-diacylgycerolhomoserine-N-methlytransferase